MGSYYLSSNPVAGRIPIVDSRRLTPRALLFVIIAVYVPIGVLYAALTPVWQVPDEPAHYNYIRSLAEGRGFPVLEPGDYDQELLSRLTTQRFPPALSVDAVEYEDHQPPLYYLLATPIYWIFAGAVLPLRLISVGLCAGLVIVAFEVVQAIFPRRSNLALATAACVAFIPQHVAISAGVENDMLAELVVGALLWIMVRYANGSHDRPGAIGVLLAFALLTKTTAYVAVGVAAVAVATRWRRECQTWRWAAGQLACMFVPALLLSAPWFVRNGLIYGWHDPMGLARHDMVVEGQLRSSDYLALHGWSDLLSRFVRFTFQSFWGQFGWMGVVLPSFIYQCLAALSVLLLMGFLWWMLDPRRPTLIPRHWTGLFLLVISSSGTLFLFLWYNLTFVQHQGRYLFPALIPMGVAAALGLNQLVRILPARVRSGAMALFFSGLAALDLVCLFRFIVPALAR